MDRSSSDRIGVARAAFWTALLFLSGWAVVHACSDPNLHPEWNEYNELAASLVDQPEVPVQMFYRVPAQRGTRMEGSLSLVFRKTPEVARAEFSVEPSGGLRLLGQAEAVEIGTDIREIKVRPLRPGVHYLQVKITAEVEGESLAKTVLIPYDVDLHGPSQPGFAKPVLPFAPKTVSQLTGDVAH